MYKDISSAIGRTAGGGGGQRALRSNMGQQAGREQMSRYSGPEARPAGELRDQQKTGADSLRSMLTQPQQQQQPPRPMPSQQQPPRPMPAPNPAARQNANPNARFNRPPTNGREALRGQMVQPGPGPAPVQAPPLPSGGREALRAYQAPVRDPYQAPTRDMTMQPAPMYAAPTRESIQQPAPAPMQMTERQRSPYSY